MNKQDEGLEFVVKTLGYYDRGLMTMREVGYDIMFKGDELDNELLSHLGHVILLGNLAVQGADNAK